MVLTKLNINKKESSVLKIFANPSIRAFTDINSEGSLKNLNLKAKYFPRL